jgi:hypothetical protein
MAIISWFYDIERSNFSKSLVLPCPLGFWKYIYGRTLFKGNCVTWPLSASRLLVNWCLLNVHEIDVFITIILTADDLTVKKQFVFKKNEFYVIQMTPLLIRDIMSSEWHLMHSFRLTFVDSTEALTNKPMGKECKYFIKRYATWHYLRRFRTRGCAHA